MSKQQESSERPAHGMHVERIAGTDTIRVTNPNTGATTVQPLGEALKPKPSK